MIRIKYQEIFLKNHIMFVNFHCNSNFFSIYKIINITQICINTHLNLNLLKIIVFFIKSILFLKEVYYSYIFLNLVLIFNSQYYSISDFNNILLIF